MGEGIYESHMNYFVAGDNAKEAKQKVKMMKEFINKAMHIDGIKEIAGVEGYEVKLIETSSQEQGEIFSYDESSDL
jgi:hypothetical protein